MANTLLTQIEPQNPVCFGRGSLRLSVISTKFWGELILDSAYFDGSLRLRVVSAMGRFSPGGGGGEGEHSHLSAYVSLDPASTVYPIKISEQQAFPNKYVIES